MLFNDMQDVRKPALAPETRDERIERWFDCCHNEREVELVRVMIAKSNLSDCLKRSASRLANRRRIRIVHGVDL